MIAASIGTAASNGNEIQARIFGAKQVAPGYFLRLWRVRSCSFVAQRLARFGICR